MGLVKNSTQPTTSSTISSRLHGDARGLGDCGPARDLVVDQLRGLRGRVADAVHAELGHTRLGLGQRERGHDLPVEARDDRRWRRGWRSEPDPEFHDHVRQPRFRRRRDIRQGRDPRLAGDHERAQLTRLDERGDRRCRRHQHLDIAAHEILQDCSRAAIRHVDEVDVGEALEQLAAHMGVGADAAGAVVELARARFGERDQLRHRTRRHRRIDRHDVRHGEGGDDVREALPWIERQRRDQPCRDRVGHLDGDQGVAVGRRPRHRAPSDRTRPAAAVLDHGRLAERRTNGLRDDARHGIGSAAGRERDHEGDRAGRIDLRVGGVRAQDRGQQQGHSDRHGGLALFRPTS